MVRAAGHIGVGVLHAGRRRDVHRAVVRLVFLRHLAQAVEFALHLVDDGAAGGRIEASDEEGVALTVEGGFDAANRAIDAATERGHRVAGHAAKHIALACGTLPLRSVSVSVSPCTLTVVVSCSRVLAAPVVASRKRVAPTMSFDAIVLPPVPVDTPYTHSVVLRRPRRAGQQVAVAGLELPRRREVVHRRGQAVATMPPRHAAQFPERVLQAVGQGLERLRRRRCHRLPVRVGQHEVVDHVIERLTGDRDVQRVHVGEVGRGEIAGVMHLSKDGELARSVAGPPLPNPTLEGASVRIEELAGMLLPQPVEERLGQQPRLGPQLRFDLGPDGSEGIDACAVGAWQSCVGRWAAWGGRGNVGPSCRTSLSSRPRGPTGFVVRAIAAACGLRKIEQAVLKQQGAEAPKDTTTADAAPTMAAVMEAAADSAAAVVLDYCAAVRGILNDDQGGPLHPPGLRMAEALNEVRESIQRNLDEKKGGSQRSNSAVWLAASTEVSTTSGPNRKRSEATSRTSRKSRRPSNPAGGNCVSRRERFEELIARFEQGEDSIHQTMAGVMTSFLGGLFVGEGKFEGIRDNLDLERWFRLPKSHQRRIHGRRHAGVRIVQEGPTLVHALDAHVTHPGPFTRGRPAAVSERQRTAVPATGNEATQDHEEGTIQENAAITPGRLGTAVSRSP